MTTNRCRLRIASATCARVASALVIVMLFPLRVFLVQVADNLLDAVLVGDGFVESELQLGDATQLQASTDVTAEERRRTLQRACRLLARLFVAHRRVVD